MTVLQESPLPVDTAKDCEDTLSGGEINNIWNGMFMMVRLNRAMEVEIATANKKNRTHIHTRKTRLKKIKICNKECP